MKKTITIMAVFLLLSMNTVFAAEYPSQVSYNLNNGIFEVRKTYEMQVDEEPSAQAKQSFEQDGYSFVLTDMLRQELPEQQSKEYTETVTVSSESKELTAILPLLADTKAVTTEDGFTGTLKLDTGSITVEPAGYKNNSWTVSATRTYPNLSSMDLEYIPKTTTENGRTLNFSTVDWQTDNTENVDDDTIGNRFSAVVTYNRAGDLVNTVVTDKNGVAKSDTLPLGRYTIRETKAPVFYSTTTQPIEVEIEFSGQIVRVEVLNQSVYTNVSVTKRGYKQVTPSQTIRYDFKNIANNSTVPLNSFYWRDTLPTSAVRLTKIITGTWNQKLSYKVVYKTNLHDYRTLADNLSTMKNYSLDASPAALGLASNEYVTDFMFVFGTVKAGFAQVDAPYILCWTNSWLNNGYQFANRTDVGGLHGGQWIMATDRWVTTVYKPGVTTLPKTGY